jgi:hypothetical protein
LWWWKIEKILFAAFIYGLQFQNINVKKIIIFVIDTLSNIFHSSPWVFNYKAALAQSLNIVIKHVFLCSSPYIYTKVVQEAYNQNHSPEVDELMRWQHLLPNIWNFSRDEQELFEIVALKLFELTFWYRSWLSAFSWKVLRFLSGKKKVFNNYAWILLEDILPNYLLNVHILISLGNLKGKNCSKDYVNPTIYNNLDSSSKDLFCSQLKFGSYLRVCLSGSRILTETEISLFYILYSQTILWRLLEWVKVILFSNELLKQKDKAERDPVQYSHCTIVCYYTN